MEPSIARAALVCAGLATTFVFPAHAQEFPTKPVRITTAFPTGAGPDVALRLIADRLSKKWGQSVIVDNKPGASGFIAVEAVKRAPADGYSLLQLDNAQMSAQPHLFKKLPYNLLGDFEPITPILRTYFFIVVPIDSPYATTGDLIKAAKAKPNAVTYGSWFVGSPGHLGGAMLDRASGTEMFHVAYKQMSQLYVGVANKEVDWAFGSAASAGPMRDAGKVRFMAVAAPKRIDGFKDIPTVGESGGPAGFELTGTAGVLAPKGTPMNIVNKISQDITAVLAEPDVAERYKTMFYEPYSLSPDEFVSLIKAESELFGETIRHLDISLD